MKMAVGGVAALALLRSMSLGTSRRRSPVFPWALALFSFLIGWIVGFLGSFVKGLIICGTNEEEASEIVFCLCLYQPYEDTWISSIGLAASGLPEQTELYQLPYNKEVPAECRAKAEGTTFTLWPVKTGQYSVVNNNINICILETNIEEGNIKVSWIDRAYVAPDCRLMEYKMPQDIS